MLKFKLQKGVDLYDFTCVLGAGLSILETADLLGFSGHPQQ